jgi:hypothetical protein
VLAEEQTISAFWQQVAWRAPGLRAGTGLVVSYPGFTFGEDVDAVNGPANFLYYPGPVSEVPVPYSLYAMKQYAWTAQEYRLGKAMQVGYRTHYGTIDPAQVLVITQARANACVHVIDRRWPWFAYDERETILLVGPGSDTSNILTGGTGPSLDSLIFGRPRAADWCYIFEQADLAAQSGDWQAALRLAQTAEQQGLKPSDRLEWMPFLQAAAALGDLTALNVMIDRITDDAYGTAQACGVLRGMLNSGIAIPDAARQVIAQRVCAPAGP